MTSDSPRLPRSLVDVVVRELREFSASTPDVGDVLVQDAQRILHAIAGQEGVTLPEEPQPPEPVWSVSEADVVGEVQDRHVRVRVTGGHGHQWCTYFAEDVVAHHLNGDCGRPFAELAEAAQVVLNAWDQGPRFLSAEAPDDVHPMALLRGALYGVYRQRAEENPDAE